MVRFALLLPIALTCCMESSAVDCGAVVCPPATVCIPDLAMCVSDAALSACDGLADGTPCATTADGPGTCRDRVCIPHTCGDGIVTPPEQCDGANVDGQTCATEGYYDDGPVTCTERCTLDLGACTGYCGDAIVQAVEACDPMAATSTRCMDLGFYLDGEVTCTAACTLNASTCQQRCGDGMVNGPELCDGGDPQLQCINFGFDYGPTTCSGNCSASLAECGWLGWRTDPLTTRPLYSLAVIDGWTYAGDYAGIVHRFNSVSASTTVIPGTGQVSGFWGTSSSNLYATRGSTIYRFDGSSWTLAHDAVDAMQAPVTLQAIHGIGTTAWAVGAAGHIYQLLGSTWQRVVLAGGADLFAIHAISDTDVVAVGASGAIARYNGTTWSSIQWTPTHSLGSVWASSSSDIYVGGDRGTLLHWNGTTWSAIPPAAIPLVTSPAASRPVVVTGTSADGVFVHQSNANTPRVWHFDGARWTELAPPTQAMDTALMAVTPSGELVLAGAAGLLASAVVRLHQAGRSTLTSPADIPNVVSIWSPSPDFIVGGGYIPGLPYTMTVVIADGGTLTTHYHQVGVFFGVWGTDRTNVFAVGHYRTIRRFDGSVWSNETMNTAVDQNVTDIWGAGTDVFVTTTEGIFKRESGPTWAPMTLPINPQQLHAIWGTSAQSVYAVGNMGTIVHWDGVVWQPMISNTTRRLSRIWGSSDANIYAVSGDQVDGSLHHYDGTAWTTLFANGPFVDVHGSGPDDVFALRGDGSALHWDGVRWAPANIGVDPGETIGASIFVDGGQWIVGGERPLFGVTPSLLRQVLRTGPGGLGK